MNHKRITNIARTNASANTGKPEIQAGQNLVGITGGANGHYTVAGVASIAA